MAVEAAASTVAVLLALYGLGALLRLLGRREPHPQDERERTPGRVPAPDGEEAVASGGR